MRCGRCIKALQRRPIAAGASLQQCLRAWRQDPPLCRFARGLARDCWCGIEHERARACQATVRRLSCHSEGSRRFVPSCRLAKLFSHGPASERRTCSVESDAERWVGRGSPKSLAHDPEGTDELEPSIDQSRTTAGAGGGSNPIPRAITRRRHRSGLVLRPTRRLRSDPALDHPWAHRRSNAGEVQ